MRSRLFLLSCALLIGSVALLSLLFALNGRATPVLAEPARLPEPAALQNTSPMTRYVALSGSDTTTCTRPLSPCRTIQQAVDVASAGDLIKVATGVYTDVHARDGYHQIAYITQTLTIRGGYTTSNWSNSNPISYPTTLDAHGAGRGIYIEPPEWPVVTQITPTIEGLRITGGYANGSGMGGGGIYAQQAAPMIRGNSIVENDASSGGGVSLWSCSGKVVSNTITNNNASTGGGIMIGQGNMHVIGNVIASNTAGYGGGIASTWSSASLIRHNTITSNTAERGGGMFMITSEATLQGNTIAANAAQHGGGAWVDTSGIYLENTVIADNQATAEGSGLLVSYSSVRLLHTTLARNGSAGGDGTGIETILLDDEKACSTVTLSNTILVSHTVGISVAEGCTVRLDGTLWGSGAWSNKADWAGAVFTGTVNLWADPGFREPDRGDYHILPDSPAVDAGIFSDVCDDVDGGPRPAGFGWDIGADESPGASLGLSASTSSSDLSPGETVTYTLALTNVGSQTTTDVHLASTLPGLQQLTHVTISQGACMTSGTWGGEVDCDLATLAPGDRRHITLTAEVTSTRPPLAQLPQWMRSTTWLTTGETTNHAHIDTILQDCHVRLNDNPAEYAVVQAAIDASTHPTDVVKIAGACTVASSRGMLPDDLDSRTQIGYIDKALTLQGGWNISFTQRDVQAYPTTLYGHVDGRVLYITDGADARVEGLRILGGRAGHRTFMGRCPGGGGVCVSRASVFIADSVIRGGEAVIGGGVSLYYESSGTLVNTVVADNRTTLAGAGAFISSDSSGAFYHATVARNTGSDGVGVRVEGAAFLTNTIVVSHTVGVHSSGNAILNATLWHGNGTDWAGDGTIDHTNDVWGDPAFVNPAGGDYHIHFFSAAVDRGVDAGIAFDMDGEPRPIGLRVDLGADEFPSPVQTLFFPIVTRKAP